MAYVAARSSRLVSVRPYLMNGSSRPSSDRGLLGAGRKVLAENNRTRRLQRVLQTTTDQTCDAQIVACFTTWCTSVCEYPRPWHSNCAVNERSQHLRTLPERAGATPSAHFTRQRRHAGSFAGTTDSYACAVLWSFSLKRFLLVLFFCLDL